MSRIVLEGDSKCKAEATWVLGNVAQGGSWEQIYAMARPGDALEAVCMWLLPNNAPDVTCNLLDTIYAILQVQRLVALPS